MELIELVIRLSEDDYKMLATGYATPTRVDNLLCSVVNGTPLPKGHGALIDKKDIDANCIPYHTDYDGSWCYRLYDIENNVPTIIEADKGDE